MDDLKRNPTLAEIVNLPEYDIFHAFSVSNKISQDLKHEFANECVVLAKEYGLSEKQIADIQKRSQLPNGDDAARETGFMLRMASYWQVVKNNDVTNQDKAIKDQIRIIKKLYERGA